MALSKAEKKRLDMLEHGMGILIGFAMGGPAGASLGNTAVAASQLSPVNNWFKDQLFDTLPARPMTDPMANQIAEMFASNSRFPRSDFATLPVKKKRRASAYSKRYGKCFKKLQSKYKKKDGKWKKDGFKRCAAAARRCAKK